MLKNWKTYFCSAALVIVAGLKAKSYLPEGIADFLELLFAGGGLAALRHAIGRK